MATDSCRNVTPITAAENVENENPALYASLIVAGENIKYLLPGISAFPEIHPLILCMLNL
jgi:hypothetical protein